MTLVVFCCLVLAIVFPNKGEYQEKNKKIEDAQNELSKDFCLIKVTHILDTIKAIDAFGSKLKTDEWYVRSNATKSVFPVNPKSYTYTELEQLMIRGQKIETRISIGNGDPMGYFVDAEILILGEKKVVLNDLERYQKVLISE